MASAQRSSAEAVRVLQAVATRGGHSIELTAAAFGGAAIDLYGDPLPPATLNLCLRADAVLLGAIGGPEMVLAAGQGAP